MQSILLSLHDTKAKSREGEGESREGETETEKVGKKTRGGDRGRKGKRGRARWCV